MSGAPHPRRRRIGLTADDIGLLSERALAELAKLTVRIEAQKAAVADSVGGERAQAKRILRRQQQWADAYLARLNRLRAGGPSCRRCGRRLSFEVLDAQVLATHCGLCPPPTSSRHPSHGQRATTAAAASRESVLEPDGREPLSGPADRSVPHQQGAATCSS